MKLVAYCYRVQKEAKSKERELVKEMEKNKREIEKEKKRMNRELQKEKWQSVGHSSNGPELHFYQRRTSFCLGYIQ